MKNSPIQLAQLLICFTTVAVQGSGLPPKQSAELNRQSRSVYTHLSGPKCKLVGANREDGSSEQLCTAIRGYQLLVQDSDNRMSVTVIMPDGTKHALEFWSTITAKFSVLGKIAEWRLKQDAAQALILQLKVNDDPNSSETTPYLIVVRLQGGDVCAINKIQGGPSAVAEARRLADSTAEASCLKQ